MARRLKDSQKKDLVEGYRSGESTTSLAEIFGCSQNTVIRIVKTLLSLDEYNALKVSRVKGTSLQLSSGLISQNQLQKEDEILQTKKSIKIVSKDIFDQDRSEYEKEDGLDNRLDSSTSLADDDNEVDDEFEKNFKEIDPIDYSGSENTSGDIFQELVPLTSDIGVVEPKEVVCEQLKPGLLPEVVYMLVDRSVELDARPLKEFSEFGALSEADKERQALSLFPNQRSAKRHCGRSQRVIKVPDTDIFEISTPFLLARGITRLVLEGALIALDAEVSTSSI